MSRSVPVLHHHGPVARKRSQWMLCRNRRRYRVSRYIHKISPEMRTTVQTTACQGETRRAKNSAIDSSQTAASYKAPHRVSQALWANSLTAAHTMSRYFQKSSVRMPPRSSIGPFPARPPLDHVADCSPKPPHAAAGRTSLMSFAYTVSPPFRKRRTAGPGIAGRRGRVTIAPCPRHDSGAYSPANVLPVPGPSDIPAPGGPPPRLPIRPAPTGRGTHSRAGGHQYTDRCNASCAQCGMRVGNRFPRSTLRPEILWPQIEAMARRGVAAISFTGGEPHLCLKDIAPLARRARTRASVMCAPGQTASCSGSTTVRTLPRAWPIWPKSWSQAVSTPSGSAWTAPTRTCMR